MLEERHPVHFGHDEVGDDELDRGRCLRAEGERSRSVLGYDHSKARLREHVAHDLTSPPSSASSASGT